MEFEEVRLSAGERIRIFAHGLALFLRGLLLGGVTMVDEEGEELFFTRSDLLRFGAECMEMAISGRAWRAVQR